MDGARLMNAVVATGTSAAEWAGGFDTAWIDFTKGLGAPVGAVLAGSQELIDEAWRYKQMIGGALRQSGIVAAGCLYALDHHVDRLAEDHANARTLADGLAELGFDVQPPDTNIVIAEVADAPQLVGELWERGIEVTPMAPTLIRCVTHLDVDARRDRARARRLPRGRRPDAQAHRARSGRPAARREHRGDRPRDQAGREGRGRQDRRGSTAATSSTRRRATATTLRSCCCTASRPPSGGGTGSRRSSARRGLRVIRFDLLGHGNSEMPRDGYAPDEQARRVAAALRKLRVRRATVVGHSMGGTVASALVEEKPRLVRRLAVIGTPPRDGFADPSFLAQGLDLAGRRRAHPPLRARPGDQGRPRLGVRGRRRRARRVRGRPRRDDLQRLRQVAVGDARVRRGPPELRARRRRRTCRCSSSSAPRTTSSTRRPRTAWAKDVPRARVVKMREVGHSPHWEQPREVAELLLDYAR